MHFAFHDLDFHFVNFVDYPDGVVWFGKYRLREVLADLCIRDVKRGYEFNVRRLDSANAISRQANPVLIRLASLWIIAIITCSLDKSRRAVADAGHGNFYLSAHNRYFALNSA